LLVKPRTLPAELLAASLTSPVSFTSSTVSAFCLTCTDMLANSERHLDMAKANSQRAEDKAAQLKVLNRSIFRPAIVWNKVCGGDVERSRFADTGSGRKAYRTGAEDYEPPQHGA
jgi:hypothetical protein